MSGKSNIMMTMMANSNLADKPIVTFDMEGGGFFYDLKTSKSFYTMRYLREEFRHRDGKRWWRRFFG